MNYYDTLIEAADDRPATYVQELLDSGAKEIEASKDPAGFAARTFVDGELISHVQPVQ